MLNSIILCSVGQADWGGQKRHLTAILPTKLTADTAQRNRTRKCDRPIRRPVRKPTIPTPQAQPNPSPTSLLFYSFISNQYIYIYKLN